MLNKLMILGGGGWFPAHGRQTACALLRDGESAVMIDAGTGIGRLVELPETRVQLRRQDRHSAPTLGLRFDDRLTWITDTAYDEASAAFAAGSQMLAHEAWYMDSQPRNPDIHSSAHHAARMPGSSGCCSFTCHRSGVQLDELLLEAQAEVPHTLLADDGADVSELLLG